MAYERHCICCGKTYQYCPHCGSFSNRPKWMFNYDEESCMEIFNVVSAYNMGVVDADKVRSVVKKYNVVDFSKYKDSIKKILTELCSAPVEVKPAVENKPADGQRKKKDKFYYEKNKDIELKTGEISE